MNSKQQVAGAPVKALLGTKLGMTQLWDEAGRLVPITVVHVGTNVVTQVRTSDVDGYSAIQLGSGELKTKNVTKPLQGHFEKAGVAPARSSLRSAPPTLASTSSARSSRRMSLKLARLSMSSAPPRVRASLAL